MKRLPTLATNPLRLPLEPPTHLDNRTNTEATTLRFFLVFLAERTRACDGPTDRTGTSIDSPLLLAPPSIRRSRSTLTMRRGANGAVHPPRYGTIHLRVPPGAITGLSGQGCELNFHPDLAIVHPVDHSLRFVSRRLRVYARPTVIPHRDHRYISCAANRGPLGALLRAAASRSR